MSRIHTRALGAAVLAGFLLSASLAQAADRESWVGKQVIPVRPRLKLTYTDDNDRTREAATLTGMVYVVTEERVPARPVPAPPVVAYTPPLATTTYGFGPVPRPGVTLGTYGSALAVYPSVPDDTVWLRLAQGDATGWLPKTEAVPVEEAVAYFSRRLRASKEDAYAHGARAVAWRLRGDFDMALEDLDAAVRLQPEVAAWRNNRGNVRRDIKDHAGALADYNQALRLSPGDAVALTNRGALRGETRDYAGALADYNQALRLAPDFARALNSRAWLLATCPEEKYRDGRRAVGDVRRACELTDWQEPAFFETLAAAYATAGEYDRAQHWQKKLLEGPRLPREARAELQKRLGLYERKAAYYEPLPPSGK